MKDRRAIWEELGAGYAHRRSAKAISVIALALFVALLLAGCGGGGAMIPPELQITAVDIPPGSGDETVTWTVEWEGGTAPYTIGITMGGGALADLPAGTSATSPYQAQFTLVNGSFFLAENHAYLVLVSDANGDTAAAQGSYAVEPAAPPQLRIKNINYNADSGLLRVTADPDGWGSLSAQLTLPAGMFADATERGMAVSAGEAVAEFYAYPADVMAGATGELAVEVLDPDTGIIAPAVDTMTISVGPPALGEGELAAIPRRRHVVEGDSVLIVLACGDFPADQPFQYMNGVGVTVEQGAEYVVDSLNYGSPGGWRGDRDGIWVDVACDTFLEGDILVQQNDIGGGRTRIDFNITPIGGKDITSGGALCNFALSFNAPGTYTLGFEEFHDVKRTYYSDGESTEYNWADISNDYPGVPNSITVVAP